MSRNVFTSPVSEKTARITLAVQLTIQEPDENMNL